MTMKRAAVIATVLSLTVVSAWAENATGRITYISSDAHLLMLDSDLLPVMPPFMGRVCSRIALRPIFGPPLDQVSQPPPISISCGPAFANAPRSRVEM
jgi:hypothetical protein